MRSSTRACHWRCFRCTTAAMSAARSEGDTGATGRSRSVPLPTVLHTVRVRGGQHEEIARVRVRVEGAHFSSCVTNAAWSQPHSSGIIADRVLLLLLLLLLLRRR